MSESAAEALARQSAAYVRGRPDYPVAIEGWLRSALGIDRGKTAVDLGSGTGKMLPRLKATGARIIAIEPLDEMRAHLMAIHPDIDAREARAQAIPLADGSVDAVICAQCFHLFADHEALQEIRRVLKPGGAMGLIWNARDMSAPWVASIVEIMAPYDVHGSAPFHEWGGWRAAFPAKGFSELEETRFDNPQSGSPEAIIIDRVLSVSAIAKLPEGERDRVIAGLWKVIAGEPELAGKRMVTFPNHCYAYYCSKTG